ncbi:radical SAM protein, partial [bacterium]|nr:radical SAM protein [bacterium]
LDELKHALLQARALGAKWIVIPGEGEPFLDENLFPLIEFASHNGLKVKIFTNGSLIDDRAATYLFRKKVSVVFKLHSLDKSAYDFLAGRNTTDWVDYCVGKLKDKSKKIPRGLKCLLEAGYSKIPTLPYEESLLQLQTIVVRPNLKAVPDIARFSRDLGIGFFVETLIRTKVVEQNTPMLVATVEEEMKVFRELSRILGWKFRLRQKVRCRFETNPFLDVSGNIRHCFGLAADIGNIRDTSLAELHEKEHKARKKMGMISKPWSWNHKGFRCCAVRRFLINHGTS